MKINDPPQMHFCKEGGLGSFFFPHGGLAVLASLKRLSFSVGLFCYLCQKSGNHIKVDLFIGSLLIPLIEFVVDPYASIKLS